MSRALLLGTLLFASQFFSFAWAQNETGPFQTSPHFPFSKTLYQWNYFCPNGVACSFICPGGDGTQIVKLRMYLGMVSFDGGQDTPAVYYEFISRQYPYGSGFSMGTGRVALSCQVNGMTLEYYGPPK